MTTASAASRKCTGTKECKKTGLIKCDGCSLRFCSNHFAVHRRDLEARLEHICVERNAFQHKLKQLHQEPYQALANIDTWEQETLLCVKKTADDTRRLTRKLGTARSNSAEMLRLSDELRIRKQNDDYFEQDIERLKQELEQLKVKLLLGVKIDITWKPIDWSKIIQIDIQQLDAELVQQFFHGTSLLTFEQQTILNGFYGKPNQRWQLIYRGTRDGFGNNAFCRLCSNRGPTMTVIVANNCLFGGYTSVSWKNTRDEVWSNDEKAFIFTLINPHGIHPTKYPIKPPGTQAIRSWGRYGPAFGCFDICIHANSHANKHSNSSFPATYTDTTGKGSKTFTGTIRFATSEIEVYRQL